MYKHFGHITDILLIECRTVTTTTTNSASLKSMTPVAVKKSSIIHVILGNHLRMQPSKFVAMATITGRGNKQIPPLVQ